MFLQFSDSYNGSTITINSDYIIKITQARTTESGTLIPHGIEIFTGTKGGNGSNSGFSSVEHYKLSDSDYENIVQKLLHSN